MSFFDSPQVRELTEDTLNRLVLAGGVPSPARTRTKLARGASRPRSEQPGVGGWLLPPPAFVIVPSCCPYFSSSADCSLVAMPTELSSECELSFWLFSEVVEMEIYGTAVAVRAASHLPRL